MRFRATDEQVKQLCANVTNASQPVGMGFVHYNASHIFQPKDFDRQVRPGQMVHLDYVEGRMVKFVLWRAPDDGPDAWKTTPNEPRPEYESWCSTYPTWSQLIASVPSIEVINE